MPVPSNLSDTFARYSLRRNPREQEFLKKGLWKGRLLVDIVDGHAMANPERVAIIDGETALTYGEVRRRTESLAGSFTQLGVGPGDIVAIQSPNWSELPLTHLALDRIGAIFLPLHDGFRDAELTHLLRLTKARVFIHPRFFHRFDYRELAEKIAPQLPDLRTRIVMRDSPAAGELGFDGLSGSRGGGPSSVPSGARSTHPSLIMVSSGTTGMPQCSVFCDDAVSIKLIEQYNSAVNLSIHDRGAAIAPAGTGTTGYNYPILGALLNGATSVLLERWNGQEPVEALRLIQRHQCTYAVVIPTQLVKMVHAARANAISCSSLRFITYAGAKLAPQVAKEAESIFGCPVQCVYGASDAGVPVMTTISDSPEKRRTAGRVLPGEEVRLIGPEGQEVAQGETGEVCWRGANSGFGYLKQENADAVDCQDQAWHRSGDLGAFDSEGYLSIVGRKKDMIIRGGRNINPGKIEEVLLQFDKVLEVAIIPFDDLVLGEIVCAVVVPADPEAPPTLDELCHFISEAGLGVWYAPERLHVVSDLPRNAGGKTDKRALIQRFGRS